jgi:hypothetical protein
LKKKTAKTVELKSLNPEPQGPHLPMSDVVVDRADRLGSNPRASYQIEAENPDGSWP